MNRHYDNNVVELKKGMRTDKMNRGGFFRARNLFRTEFSTRLLHQFTLEYSVNKKKYFISGLNEAKQQYDKL